MKSSSLRHALLAALFAAACDCGGAGLKQSGPVIQVDPTSVAFEGAVGREDDFTLRVSNIGNDTLHLDAPAFTELDGDADVEFTILSAFANACDDRPRAEAGRMELGPGDCALLVVRYKPTKDGPDAADLHLYSDDSDSPDLVVEFRGQSLTPALEACSVEGSTTPTCATPGQPFAFVLGQSAIGVETKRTLRLTSKGTSPVRIDGLALSGDTDFEIDPATLEKSLAPGESADVVIKFKPALGGPREAELVVTNTDPRQPRLSILLSGTGDAARLCVGICDSPTEPFGNCSATGVDFGRLEPGEEAKRYVIATSCGTRDLTLTAAAVTEGAPAFSGSGSGTTLRPGQRLPPVTVTFKPPAEDTYAGRFTLDTSAGKSFLTLAGRGKVSGCKLEAPYTTIDFGQGAVGQPKAKEFAVSNRGTETCVLPSPPKITNGAGVFAFKTAPTATTLGPGRTLRLSLTYTAPDLTGPDTGNLEIPFAESAPGAPTSKLTFQLRGTPSAQATCILDARPAATSGVRTLSFGDVVRGTRRTLPVRLENIGADSCRIVSWQVTGTDASAYAPVAPADTLLAPGETTLLPVTFSASALRAFTAAKLLVSTSDTTTYDGRECAPTSSNAGCLAFTLSGKGISSDLRVIPESLDFGQVTLGCRSRELKVTLYNTGRSTLTIKSFRLDPPPPPDVFRIVAPPVPLTLAAAGQASVSVRFLPPTEGLHTGSLLIESQSGTATAVFAVPMRGEGVIDSHRTDTFEQGSSAKSDVLLVIDNSGSMSQEQGSLAGNAQTFLNQANNFRTDYHVGVVTTDMSRATQSGRLQASGTAPRIITPTTPNPAPSLSTTVRSLGTSGSSSEKGLDAMVAALSSPLVDDPTANQGFLRADARLAVVIVSDEEDSSTAPVDYYVDFLRNLKGAYGSSLVSLSAIVGDPAPTTNRSGRPGCSGPGGDAVTGARYIDAANRTGGKFRSICTSDWGRVAADIGLDAFNTRSGFGLSRPADPSTLTVRIDSQTTPAWDYDPPGNGVVFDPQNVPPPGARVTVEYDALCQ